MNTDSISEFEVELAQTAAPLPSADSVAALLDDLQDAGCVIPDLAAAYRSIERAMDETGDRRAAETLRIVFQRLPGGRRGIELKAALLGTLNLAGEARKLGVAPSVFHRGIMRLKSRLFPKTDDRSDLSKGAPSPQD